MGPSSPNEEVIARARLFGRCEPTTGIEPFGRLVEQVMTVEPYASRRTPRTTSAATTGRWRWPYDGRKGAEMTEMTICSHLDQVRIIEPPAEIAGCEECLKIGSSWVHLRMCETCGKIGCCDSSPNRHATGHAREVGHPVLRSVEPGEDWSWCVIDEVDFILEAG